VVSHSSSSVPLDQLLRPVCREEAVDPHREYALLGARWYAQGLYTKEIKLGTQVRAQKLFRVREGDFVYNRLFAWKGSFAIATSADDGCYVSNEFPCFDVRADALEPHYLQWYFSREAAWNEALGLSFGATPTSRNRLKQENLLRMTIPLPSLAEQRRIVAKIDQLAARIDEATGIRFRAERTRDVLTTSARAQCFEAIKRQVVPLALARIADCRLGKMLSKSHQSGLFAKPYLRNANIHNDRIDLASVYEMDFEDRERDRFRLVPGDVLINEGGYGVGRCAVWQGEIKECFYQKSLHRVRVDQRRIDPRFLMHHMIWAGEAGHFADITMTTTFHHLTGVRLKRYEVLIPAIQQQRRIVAYLDDLQAKVDRLKALQAQTAAELDALLPAILDRAFKGEL